MPSTQETTTAPKTVKENTLPGLPEELLEAIAKECDPSDLLALRQASRLVHYGIDRTFLREYFTDRNHIITVGSLEDLIHITATPRMCKTLEKLTLSIPWLSGKHYDTGGIRACTPPCTHEDHKDPNRSPNCAVWAAWLEAKNQLTHCMRTLLEQALGNIASMQGTRCLHINLMGSIESAGRVHGKASFERYLSVPMYVPNSSSRTPLISQYGRNSTHNLLYAVATSGVILQELHFPNDLFFSHDDRCKELVPEWEPEWFLYLEHKAARCFSNIHTIGLGEHAHRWLPPLDDRLPGTIGNWFPALTSVSLPAYVDMRRLIATFPPGKLKKMNINGNVWVVHWDEIKALFGHHRSSLLHVGLTRFIWSYARLRPPVGEIEDLLRWIADNLKLQSFKFQGSKLNIQDSENKTFEWRGDIKAEISDFLDSKWLITKPPGDEPDDEASVD